MEISNIVKTITLLAVSLNYAQAFATEPDWRKQNAQIESIEADTAKTKSDTAAQNANTAAQNANTASQNANTASQNANTATQNANTSTSIQNANTASQNANTASQNANTAAQRANPTFVVVTPVPTPKETSVVPAGFTNCVVIKSGWFNGVWVPEHRVCMYNASKEGATWIEGYWACTQYKTLEKLNGECTKWNWKPGHWAKTFEVY